jgi:hypothetical protein
VRGAGWLVVLVVLLAVGCGAAGASSPEAALRELRGALERRDAEAAYALMSRSYRSRVPFDAFRALVEGDEAARAAGVLSRVEGPAEIEARVVLADGQEVLLSSEEGAFRLESDVVDYYSQRTPRDALRSFVRAADHRRFDVLLRLLPQRDREGLTAEVLAERWAEDPERMERLVGALRMALGGTIDVSADRATLVAPGAHATFVLEGERWVVEDPD